MSQSNQLRFTTRLVAFAIACTASLFVQADADRRATTDQQACGTQGNPIDVMLPYEMQASYLHSLPIAGLLVTPDAAAQRVLSDPRLRATTAKPTSGKGMAYPIDPSSVVVTRADRFP
jgi:hypothetical protein